MATAQSDDAIRPEDIPYKPGSCVAQAPTQPSVREYSYQLAAPVDGAMTVVDVDAVQRNVYRFIVPGAPVAAIAPQGSPYPSWAIGDMGAQEGTFYVARVRSRPESFLNTASVGPSGFAAVVPNVAAVDLSQQAQIQQQAGSGYRRTDGATELEYTQAYTQSEYPNGLREVSVEKNMAVVQPSGLPTTLLFNPTDFAKSILDIGNIIHIVDEAAGLTGGAHYPAEGYINVYGQATQPSPIVDCSILCYIAVVANGQAATANVCKVGQVIAKTVPIFFQPGTGVKVRIPVAGTALCAFFASSGVQISNTPFAVLLGATVSVSGGECRLVVGADVKYRTMVRTVIAGSVLPQSQKETTSDVSTTQITTIVTGRMPPSGNSKTVTSFAKLMPGILETPSYVFR